MYLPPMLQPHRPLLRGGYVQNALHPLHSTHSTLQYGQRDLHPLHLTHPTQRAAHSHTLTTPPRIMRHRQRVHIMCNFRQLCSGVVEILQPF